MSKRDELIAMAKGKRSGYWIERHKRENGQPDVFCIRTPNEKVAPTVLFEWGAIGIAAEHIGLTKELATSFPIYDFAGDYDEKSYLIAPVDLMRCLFSIQDRSIIKPSIDINSI